MIFAIKIMNGPPTDLSTILPDTVPIIAFGACPHNEEHAEAIARFVGPKGIILDLRQEHEHGPYETDWKAWNVKVMNLPTPDRGAPPVTTLKATLHEVIQNQVPIYIHCRGGHGRAGTVTACLLIELGYQNTNALQIVHSAHQKRKSMAQKFRRIGSPQTQKQKQFVRVYQPQSEF